MVREDWYEQLRKQIKEGLDNKAACSDDELYEWIEDLVFQLGTEEYISAKMKSELAGRLFHSFRGLDVLQPLVDDPTITEIMINSHEEIFIEREGRMFLHPLQFENSEKLEDIIQSIVGKVNRVVNESSPIVDARLRDGSRVNIVLPPIALKGPTMTIRKFPQQPMNMENLLARGSLSQEAKELLEQLVIAKYNVFIGGGTGSGKTTFLNALASLIPKDERIITIEDSAELQLQDVPNLVRLETRNANTEGRGQITIRQLIRTSLRMRPNRIIVGEVRGEEALDMLQAMNTGHDGSLSTGHANSVHDMLSRLETMVLSGAALPIEVIRKQISSAIDIMIHLSRLRDKTRKVTEISEVMGVEDGEILLNPLFKFVEDGNLVTDAVNGRLVATGNKLQNTAKLQMAGIRREESG